MIKGISEQRRLPRLGHLRLGSKKLSKNKKLYPAEVDYFVMDPKTPDPKWNEQLKDQFHSLYGLQPKAIKIMFPPVPEELFFAQWYKRYGSSTLVKCKGDGEVATTSPDFSKGLEKIGEDERGFIQVKCLGPECPHQKKNECGRMASLQVILPDIKGMGVWQINTGSYNSIVNMNSAIEWLKGLCGRFAMIPVTLMRVPQDIQYEGKKSKHYILQVDQQHFSIGDIQKLALVPIVRSMITGPDESKDTMFYDAAGQKPAQIEHKPAEAEVVDPAKKPGKGEKVDLKSPTEDPIASPERINELYTLGKELGLAPDEVTNLSMEHFSKTPDQLTEKEASNVDALIIKQSEATAKQNGKPVAEKPAKKASDKKGDSYLCKKCGRTIVKGQEFCPKHRPSNG